jgi:hypothetical protein
MSVFGKAKCLVGIHDFGNWSYIGSTSCEQIRRCKRDSSHSQKRVEHTWSEYSYIEKDSCVKRRTCSRCDAKEDMVEHESLGEWTFVRPDHCAQEQRCARCKEVHNRTYHSWGVWEYASPTTCDQIRKCRRCPDGEEHKLASDFDHRWKGETKVSCDEKVNECERCGKRKSRIGSFHEMGEWKTDTRSGRNYRELRYCQDCNHFEARD